MRQDCCQRYLLVLLCDVLVHRFYDSVFCDFHQPLGSNASALDEVKVYIVGLYKIIMMQFSE